MKMVKQKIRNLALAFVIILILTDCRDITVPKPKGHFRIDFPQRQYIEFNDQPGGNNQMPFSFEYPAYGNLTYQEGDLNETGWFNIEFPAYMAKIYLTYKDINHDFDELMDQTYKMNVKNHITKADAITEQPFNNKEKNVYGILYDLKGNTASAVQFYLTDSTKHFLRGSLYFSSEPDADSLEPVIKYFREDIIHLIETLEWKN